MSTALASKTTTNLFVRTEDGKGLLKDADGNAQYVPGDANIHVAPGTVGVTFEESGSRRTPEEAAKVTGSLVVNLGEAATLFLDEDTAIELATYLLQTVTARKAVAA